MILFSTCLSPLLVLLPPAPFTAPQRALQSVEEAKLVDDDPADQEECGWSVAIDGDTAVIGIPGDTLSPASSLPEGSAQVYRRSATGWSLEATLTARNPYDGSSFGSAVSISDSTIAVTRPDSVQVFVRGGSGWSQQALLIPADPEPVVGFGPSVAIDGDTIVAGSFHKTFVFSRQGTTWTQQARLVPGNGNGGSVAIDGDTIVSGNRSGRVAQVFVRNAATWTLQATLVPRDWLHAYDFGWSVALDGDTAIVGAILGHHEPGAGPGDGTAHVFTRSGSSWSQQARFDVRDDLALAHSPANFGCSVDVQGDLAVVGMSGGGGLGVAASGCAYVYQRSGQSWTRQLKLTAADAAPYDGFGWSIGLDGRRVVIGAFVDDHGGTTDAGSAYIFALSRQ